jgi:hypothetical protein
VINIVPKTAEERWAERQEFERLSEDRELRQERFASSTYPIDPGLRFFRTNTERTAQIWDRERDERSPCFELVAGVEGKIERWVYEQRAKKGGHHASETTRDGRGADSAVAVAAVAGLPGRNQEQAGPADAVHRRAAARKWE